MLPLKILGRSYGPKGKVLLFGKRKRSVQYAKYIFKALSRKGFEVLWVYVPEVWLRGIKGVVGYAILKGCISRFRPRLFIARSVTLKASFLKKIEALRVAVFPVPFTEGKVPKDFLEAARSYHYFFVNWMDDGTLKSMGINARFFMQGMDPEEYFPSNPHPGLSAEVSFIGKPYFNERVQFLKKVSDRLDLKAHGGRWDFFGIPQGMEKVMPKDFSKICASSKINLGYDIRADLKYHFSIRLWLTLGCGGFYMTNYVEGFEDLFKNHHHLVWFKDFEEFLDLAKFYLVRDEKRRKIAQKGYQFVVKNRTYDHVVEDILRELRI